MYLSKTQRKVIACLRPLSFQVEKMWEKINCHIRQGPWILFSLPRMFTRECSSLSPLPSSFSWVKSWMCLIWRSEPRSFHSFSKYGADTQLLRINPNVWWLWGGVAALRRKADRSSCRGGSRVLTDLIHAQKLQVPSHHIGRKWPCFFGFFF